MSQVGAATRSSPSPRPAPGCSAPQPPGCWAGSQPPPGLPPIGFRGCTVRGLVPRNPGSPRLGASRGTRARSRPASHLLSQTMKACPPSRAAAEQIKQAPYGAKTRWKWGQTQEAGGWQSLHPHARPHLELQARVGLGRALHRAGAAPAAPAPCSAGARLRSSAWLCSEPLVPLPACSGAEDGTEAAHGSPSSCGGSGWTWLTSGWALDLPGITPCTLPHGSLRSPALPPESQIQGELQPASPLQSLQPQKLAGIPPYSFRTPQTSSPAVGRTESGIFFYLPQPSPHLDMLPQTCSSQVPVCFQACHLHTGTWRRGAPRQSWASPWLDFWRC